MQQKTKQLPGNLTQLIGHNSEETAYIQNDFPFGYRHRTERKYWIETTKHGQRLCTRLKHALTGKWFAVKKSTYNALEVLVLNNENNHVETRGYSNLIASDHKQIDEFATTYELDETQMKKVKLIIAEIDIMNKVFAEVKPKIEAATSENPLNIPTK
jgi:hypothetical protein